MTISLSPVNAVGSLFDYSLGQDSHIERSGVVGEAYPVISLGAPGSIHPLERRPMDLAAGYVNVSGGTESSRYFHTMTLLLLKST